MNQLHLVFFLIGLVLFAGIALFSYAQKKGLVWPKPSRSSRGELNPPSLSEDAQPADSDSDASEQDPGQKAVKGVEASKLSAGTDKQSSKGASKTAKANTKKARKGRDANSSLASDGAIDNEAKDEPIEPTIEPVDVAQEAHKEAPKETQPQFDQNSSDLITELVARIKNPSPIEQQELLGLFREHDYKFHRKVHIFGLNELTDMWRDIEFELPSARFLELGVSIQLADREGCMTQKEIHDFQQMVLAFTNFYDAPFEFSIDLDEALAQANTLDQIGRRYDSMAVLNVVPKARAGFRMADIESCARDLMMSSDKNGIFMKTQGQKHNLSVLYRLACTDGGGQFGVSGGSSTPVHDLVVYMNVPGTQDPEKVFQEMVKDANDLATWLDGKVVDRNGRVMSQRSYSVLMQQVSDIAFSMQQDGLSPGDAVAKKLF